MSSDFNFYKFFLKKSSFIEDFKITISLNITYFIFLCFVTHSLHYCSFFFDLPESSITYFTFPKTELIDLPYFFSFK